ncbi:hypothetical protein [Vulgatibacter sp.]|uniref:hypothetical protein n=1 Tax=Vulgatibacter sp. TaxID=1971226 RepID=UPI00356849ED
MPRITPFALLALVVAAASPTSAQAADESDLSSGVASILITSATPRINFTVQNVSPSTSPMARQLEVVSSPPVYSLSGQIFCKPILSGTTRLTKSQLVFGTPVVINDNDGASLWPIGVWDSSDPVFHQGSISSANVSFQHEMDVPTTWNGGLVNLGFNPVKIVEDRLATWVSGGGSELEFLQQDDVFEVQIPVNLVGDCRNTSSYGVHDYAGYTRRWITAAIFYVGDPDLLTDAPVMQMPGGLQAQQPRLPPQFFVNTPFTAIPIDGGGSGGSGGDGGSGGAGGSGGDDGTGGGPITVFARYGIYDFASSSYDGLWSGWVTYESESCLEVTQTAVTPSGECVLVETCMPAEFDSCRALAGCCDAPLPATPRSTL